MDGLLTKGQAFLATPAGKAVVALIVVLLTLVLISSRSGGRGKGSKGGKGGAGGPKRKEILLVGPSSSGKTCLQHVLMKGFLPQTVASSKVGELAGKLWSRRNAGNAPAFTLVDVPGHAIFKKEWLQRAATSSGIVFTIDSASAGAAGGAGGRQNSLTAAADFIYELFSNRAIVEARVPILFCCCRSDASGAAQPSAIQKALEQQLERLKVSRPAIATAGEDGMLSGSSAGTGSLGDTLLLGVQDRPFSFEEDAPCPALWASCSAKQAAAAEGEAGRGVEDVEAFLEQAIQGRIR